MKVALCLHGLVGSTKNVSYDRDESDFDGKKLCTGLASRDWKKYIIDENDVDVFIHSWELDLEDYLVESYQPKKYQMEKQVIFKPEHKEDNSRNRACYSRFYGFKKVIELKQKYEKDNNFKYDCVVVSRFDLAWNRSVKFSDYDMSYFYNVELIKDGTWFGYPRNTHLKGTKERKEIMDWFFFSNSEFMDRFSLLYDYIGHYNKTIYQWKGMSPHFLIYAYLEEIGVIPDLLKPGLKGASPNSTEWLDDDYCNIIRRAYFNENIRPGKQGEVLCFNALKQTGKAFNYEK